MPYEINETHDPKLESWVESANDPETDFPIQNLPVCSPSLGPDDFLLGAFRLGDQYIDILALLKSGLVTQSVLTWGQIDALPPKPLSIHGVSKSQRQRFRSACVEIFSSTDPDVQERAKSTLIPVSECGESTWGIGDFTDFYASVFHATNVGSMFRPDNALLPNYKWIPVGYHGRASSVILDGMPVRRPHGQQAPASENDPPSFGPCKMLDYELELGVVIRKGNLFRDTIPIDEAEEHILGLCLLNDWSARDLQKWEYQPLGPFLAKSFATSVSPYIVTMEALAPFRVPAMERAAGDPSPLPHLFSERDQSAGGIDVTLEVHLASQQMREKGMDPIRLSKGNFKDMYWTIAQMVTHHASNGCNLQPGDLLGSGTVSGPTRESRGCLLELTWDGDPWATPAVKAPGTQRTPIELPTGETRKFLADGDEVILKGYCEREGYRRIGFGECRGIIEPAKV